MSSKLRKMLDRAKPHFEPGGRFEKLHSVFDGFETFLYTPRSTSPRSGAVHIHSGMDSKRAMIIVVLALMPCFVFGLYNTGYQHWLAAGQTEFPFWSLLLYGFLAVLPRVVVTYAVGLGIEFIVAQMRREEIQEGFLVSGILIPMICPIETPLWMLAVATAFAVIFAKEVFGGTGYNIFNVALVTRAFLFFAYPAQMSGDKAFVAVGKAFGFGPEVVNADAFTCATPLGQIATASDSIALTGIDGQAIGWWDAFLGLIPGSVGETSTLCILVGALILLVTRMADWRIMLSVVVGGAGMAWLSHALQTPTYMMSTIDPWMSLLLGGFMFAAVFMATDPVTACRTNVGKYIYGLLIGIVAILIRTYNNGYPEGAMLAVLLGNALAPLIDYCVVEANVRRRQRRLKSASQQA